MSDPSFEHQLTRLFAETPSLPDGGAFAAAVSRRLERGWRTRRLLIGAAGSVGGLLAATQVVQANLVQRVAVASQDANGRAQDLAAEGLARAQAWLHLHDLPVSGEALWMVAGLGALGLGLAAARFMDAL